ncbi:uncharacterized protein LOC125550832 isoform X2 [Triticum urartu]|uniref:uncharacterized protein LOC125550832 isoform X2 n=1 Tax=Triticum urartu TaxID=4572 RepID=UPI0020439E4F|nr:uncharacterized protein LOC125550832 isoform X2 [Triticum urartu]
MGGGTRAAWRSVAAVAGGRGREGRPDEGSVVFRGQSSPGEGPGCSARFFSGDDATEFRYQQAPLTPIFFSPWFGSIQFGCCVAITRTSLICFLTQVVNACSWLRPSMGRLPLDGHGLLHARTASTATMAKEEGMMWDLRERMKSKMMKSIRSLLCKLEAGILMFVIPILLGHLETHG